MSERERQSGLTLLELLVALTVLSFLMVALTHGLRTGFRLWNVQSRELGRTAELDAAARVFRTLLTGIPISPASAINPGSDPIAISFRGKADSLAFVGNLASGLGTDRRAEIELGLHGGRVVLTWIPRRHELGGARPAATETEVIKGVTRLEFAYWGVPSAGASPAWLDEWDGPSIPQLIRIRLDFAKGDIRRWPDLIVAPQL